MGIHRNSNKSMQLVLENGPTGQNWIKFVGLFESYLVRNASFIRSRAVGESSKFAIGI